MGEMAIDFEDKICSLYGNDSNFMELVDCKDIRIE